MWVVRAATPAALASAQGAAVTGHYCSGSASAVNAPVQGQPTLIQEYVTAVCMQRHGAEPSAAAGAPESLQAVHAALAVSRRGIRHLCVICLAPPAALAVMKQLHGCCL